MTDKEKMESEVRTYAFIRKDGWYPLDLPCETVADNAACNPGTVRVIEAISGKIVWERSKA